MFDFGMQRARPSFNAKDKEFLYSRQKGRCAGCNVAMPMRNLTVDHIRPFSGGGSDKPSNLQLLCNSCNSTKGTGTQSQLKKKLQSKGVIKASPKKPAAKPAAKKKKPQRRSNDPFGFF